MRQALAASTVYFLALFALGFVLGTIRVMLVVPRLGLLPATALEVPIILVAALIACRRAVSRWQVPPELSARAIMVLWFLALLMIAEAALGFILFDRSVPDQWAEFRTPAGALGLSAQIVAASLPFWVGMRNGR